MKRVPSETSIFCARFALILIALAAANMAHADTVIGAWGESMGYRTFGPRWLNNIKSIAAGYQANFAVTSRGLVENWVQLGRSGFGSYPLDLSNIVAVAAGASQNIALKEDETVVAFGGGPVEPPNLSEVIAIAAGCSHFLALKSDGTVVAWGQATVPPGLSNVVAIAAGEYHSLALKAEGTVVAWGSNLYGEGSVPDGLSNITAIAAGAAHNLALDRSGKVRAWGLNSTGQLNVPSALSNITKVAAGRYHGVALKNDGTVTAWGDNKFGQTDVPMGLTHVVALSACENVTLALAAGDIPPFVAYEPVGGWVPAGTNFYFLCLGQGSDTPGLTYQWHHDGTNIASNGTALALPHVQPSDSGLYSVSISNAFGVIQTADALLVVTNNPSRIVPIIVPISGIAGSSFSFSVVNYDSSQLLQEQLNSFELLVSTNLVDWIVLPNSLIWTNGSMLLQDSATSIFKTRFYRVLQH
jgi:hypothetical protein